MNGRWRGALAVAALVIATALIYQGILWPTGGTIPWASDTLGHVMKVEYFREQWANGVFYPELFPNWYMGVQMLRYWPPLSYVLVIGLAELIGDSIVAVNWYIALCAFIGALGWLRYKRWVGWLPALLGGMLYLFLPDNVRVALSEGNVPRVLATAILPWALYSLFRAFEEDGGWRQWLTIALLFTAIVLSHAMMAAIYGACFALIGLVCWLSRATTFKRFLNTVIVIGLGVLLSGWWFLPSLTGGITELDSEAIARYLPVFSLSSYLDPTLRLRNIEVLYPGAALLVLSIIVLIANSKRDQRAVGLTLTGVFGILISTPGFNDMFNALPMHHLFWPARFMGIASSCLVLALVFQAKGLSKRWVGLPILLLLLISVDNAISIRLIHLRQANPDVVSTAFQMKKTPGWRQATLDYSRLGSSTSYYYTAVSQREQLYGWAYQGARTARNVAALNESLKRGFNDYLLDRLALLGTDDVILLDGVVSGQLFPDALLADGYQETYNGKFVTQYHKDGGPRAVIADWPALGIGTGSINLTYLFPQMVVGGSTKVDDYTVEELAAYDTLFLSGFGWNKRQDAEALIIAAAETGVNVVVDLTRVPVDPLAREPLFLDVWGEPLTLEPQRLDIISQDGEDYPLKHYTIMERWVTFTPQGTQHEVLYHDFLGTRSTVLGYNAYGAGRVWFVGLNMPYHAMLTQDPTTVDMLAYILDLPTGGRNTYQFVSLDEYVPSHEGYTFSYSLETADAVMVPVAHHDITEVWVDGTLAKSWPLENLVTFEAPAGEHQVVIRVRHPRIYLLGKIASGMAFIGLVLLIMWNHKQQAVTEPAIIHE